MGIKKLFIVLYLLIPVSLAAGSLTDKIINNLYKIKNYRGIADFYVTLPMTDEDVHYRLYMSSRVSENDTLCPYDYFIEVESDTHPTLSGSFMTYFDGNYFNFGNGRLREYHVDENAVPFTSRLSGNHLISGVHRSGLFPGELPQELAFRLETFKSNPTAKITEYPDTIVDGRRVDALAIEEWGSGELMRSLFITFDIDTGLPINKEIENNPGHIGSQTVVTHYFDNQINIDFPSDFFSEERLLREKSEIMQLYRNSNYRAESLKGKESPFFSLPLASGNGRFDLENCKGKSVVLAFVDTEGSFCNDVLAIAKKLKDTDICWVTLYRESLVDEDLREKLNGPGIVVSNAASVAMRYGVVGYPTVFVVNKVGIVTDIYIGYSPELRDELESAIMQ